MIPNDIIPLEPMRNAVTKTSEDFDVIEWLETELSAIDCVYRGSPTYDHDAYWMKERVENLLREAKAAFVLAPPAPEPQPEVAAEPVAWRIRDEGDRDWMALVFDDPRFDVALAAVPGLVAEPLYAGPPPVVEEAVKAEWEACAQQVFEYLDETISANDGNRQLMIEAGLLVNETDRRGLLLKTIRDDLSEAIRARSATP